MKRLYDTFLLCVSFRNRSGLSLLIFLLTAVHCSLFQKESLKRQQDSREDFFSGKYICTSKDISSIKIHDREENLSIKKDLIYDDGPVVFRFEGISMKMLGAHIGNIIDSKGNLVFKFELLNTKNGFKVTESEKTSRNSNHYRKGESIIPIGTEFRCKKID